LAWYDSLLRSKDDGKEDTMSTPEKVVAWVVFRMTLHGKRTGVNAVCEQREWDEMEARQPGYHTLVRAGIANEGEAERLARGTAGDQLSSRARRL
jgi:hypothetical protein